ncbi:hypothetical protein CLOACE_13120 [Clostridium acetireducens DSM 10703]|uniref:Uncharacterized protein n=1 Tax=Clostridium acetireducens DSM 10703 TaxID=1121290 RepID=A0A1E8EYK5_9CLOT|nr:hypothetical protein [Clostridium acetireducens]OFI06057.1 hypothetical protein CLOACE_13120 [Clostridium acetireducens DSM 10703]
MTIPSNISCKEKYTTDILKSESEMAKCLSELFCCDLVHDIKKIDCVEKKAEIIKKILCAYSCKEKAMACLINSLSSITPTHTKVNEISQHCCNNDILCILLILLLICKRCIPF